MNMRDLKKMTIEQLIQLADDLRQRNTGAPRLRFGTFKGRFFAAVSIEHELECTAPTFREAVEKLIGVLLRDLPRELPAPTR